MKARILEIHVPVLCKGADKNVTSRSRWKAGLPLFGIMYFRGGDICAITILASLHVVLFVFSVGDGFFGSSALSSLAHLPV